MANKNDRFVRVYKEGSSLKNEGFRQLLVDRQTGVTYLMVHAGYGTCITPLLNRDGSPTITRVDP